MPLIQELPSSPNDSLIEKCLRSLQLRTQDWNWFVSASDIRTESHLQEALEILETQNSEIGDERRLQIIIAISQYANENTPWSNTDLARKALSVPRALVEPLLPRLFSYFQDRLLKSSPKVTLDRNPRAAKNRGLRPILGHSTPTSELDLKRKEWKESDNLYMIGSVCFWMHYDTSPESVALIAAFTLNVMDDSDPAFRAQGCFLIRKLIENGFFMNIHKLGLVLLFKEEIRVCFNFLPRLTPGSISLGLMRAAYPTIVAILDEEKEQKKEANSRKYLSYLEILDLNILGLISHIQSHAEEASNSLIQYLLSFGTELIKSSIGAAVLACFSRLNATLCRLITDPIVVDSDNGPLVVEAALNLQNTVLSEILHAKPGASDLLLSYKYDFIAAWSVYQTRVLRYGVGTPESKELVRSNFALLIELARQNETTFQELEEDLRAIKEQNTELELCF
ncbi:hypothetical protein PUMCH_002372 [Australozyma saopauloensis]|uniref:Uncharacterized protein n=1 Tax=Australozyma saopauloensis TaxID=291208 RepID=A0AAX4H9V9_9ASCO|nr:hypothetical protein PUMCH_002372 [[Candida] saopauloensis]